MKGRDKRHPPLPRSFCLLPSAFIFCLLAGCARYEYDVVEPAELAGHVGGRSWVALRRGDIEYRMRSYDDRLVMHIYNRGDAPVKLLGADSAAVDPRGESHPLQSATIPPGSFIKRIFPPPPPRVRPYGPTFGVGVGVAYGARRGHALPGRPHRGFGRYPFARRHRPYYRGGFYDPFDDFGPRYYSIYDPTDRTHFRWPGGTSVRFLFTYEREGGERFRHEFLIRRTRV